MGAFSDPLVIKEIGYERWEIVETFSWTSNKGLVVPVFAGFQTDLASVPQALRSIVPKVGYWSQAAVVHDMLYRRHRIGMDATVTRLQADRALREGARDKARIYNVPQIKWRHWQIYHAVRLWGEHTWETPEEKTTRLQLQEEESLYE